MPTGYTAGIIDGKYKTFKDYATQCARAFGATIHMRDEPMDKPYEPATPGDYHAKKIAEAKELLAEAEGLTDKEIVERRIAQLNESKSYHEKRITEIKEGRKRLDSFLTSAKTYNPPTDDHKGIGKFLIQQIEETIKWDGDTDSHEKELEKVELELADNVSPSEIRKEMIQKANKDLQYHEKEQAAEEERCKKANEWVEKYFKSLE